MNPYTRWLVQAIVDTNPRSLIEEVPKTEWPTLLVRALQNRSLYHLALILMESEESKRLSENMRATLERVISQALSTTSRYDSTGGVISQMLNEKKARGLIFKTYRPFPHVASDVDVLVEPAALQDLSESLSREGFLLKNHYDFPFLKTQNEICATAPDGTKVDIHTEYAKEGRTIFRADTALADRRLLAVRGHNIWYASQAVEMLALLSNIMLERKHVSLSDILYFDHLCKGDLDIVTARNEAAKNEWGNEFDYALSLTNDLLGGIGRVPHSFPELALRPKLEIRRVSLPHLLGFSDILQIASKSLRLHPPTAIVSVLYWIFADLRRRLRGGSIIGMDATWFDRRDLKHLTP